MGGIPLHCEGRPVTGAPPLLAARPRGVGGAGVGTQHQPHSVRSCEPESRAVGVAGGRPRGGRPPAAQPPPNTTLSDCTAD